MLINLGTITVFAEKKELSMDEVMEYIEKSKQKRYERLIKENENPNKIISDGYTLFSKTVELGKTKEVKCMLKKRIYDLETPLIIAINNENWEIVELILKKRVNLNVMDRDKETILNLLIKSGKIMLVKRAIRKRINLNLLNGRGLSSLALAIKSDRIEIAKLLINKGCNINLGEGENLPLISAVNLGNLEFIEKLLKRGANGKEMALDYAYFNKDIDAIRLLIKYGADINELNGNNDTLLHIAIEDENLEIASLLIKSKAKYLEQAFSLSIDSGIKSLQDEIIQKNIDYNLITKDGHTLLTKIIAYGDLELLKKIERYKLDYNKVNENGYSALELAKTNEKIFNYLKNKGVKFNK